MYLVYIDSSGNSLVLEQFVSLKKNPLELMSFQIFMKE